MQKLVIEMSRNEIKMLPKSKVSINGKPLAVGAALSRLLTGGPASIHLTCRFEGVLLPPVPDLEEFQNPVNLLVYLKDCERNIATLKVDPIFPALPKFEISAITEIPDHW